MKCSFCGKWLEVTEIDKAEGIAYVACDDFMETGDTQHETYSTDLIDITEFMFDHPEIKIVEGSHIAILGDWLEYYDEEHSTIEGIPYIIEESELDIIDEECMIWEIKSGITKISVLNGLGEVEDSLQL